MSRTEMPDRMPDKNRPDIIPGIVRPGRMVIPPLKGEFHPAPDARDDLQQSRRPPWVFAPCDQPETGRTEMPDRSIYVRFELLSGTLTIGCGGGSASDAA